MGSPSLTCLCGVSPHCCPFSLKVLSPLPVLRAPPPPGCSQGYGDKSWGIVTSIRSKLADLFQAEGKIICCSISNGLEMDLKGKFMPPITEARKKTV